MTKTRAFPTKSCQNISSSVGMTKTRVSPTKSYQNISSSVGMTKTRVFPTKSCQNCANLLCRNNISRDSPENKSAKKSNHLTIKDLRENSG